MECKGSLRGGTRRLTHWKNIAVTDKVQLVLESDI